MTVESEVANLTTAVDNLTSAVNVKKATLDASVANAQSARDAAATSATSANNDKLAAQAAATSATNTAAALTGFDLEAIAASKAVTAVDVFVYDTSKDSDGGAWRKRTQHTSWYNEALNTATRGSRREFPAVAVIVAEAAKVTIYDGDDPALPMWKVIPRVSATVYEGFWYNSQNLNALTAGQGRIIIAVGASSNASGMRVLDFAGDEIERYTAQLNNGSTYYTGTLGNIVDGINGVCQPSGLNPIVNFTVNDVAMTVLPDAPIDPATGLPVPTIAVATNGGVSVIKDDGTVVDITGQAQPVLFVNFSGSNELVTTGNYQDQYYVYAIPPTDILQNDATYRKRFYVFNQSPAVLSGVSNDLIDGYKGSSAGLTVLAEDQATPANGMVNYITSSYQSGWQNGDIKGAFLADTDDTDLVGSGNLHSDPTCDVTTTFSAQTADWTMNGDIADVNSTVAGKIYVKAGASGFLENAGNLLSGNRGVWVTFTISNSSANYGVRVSLRPSNFNADGGKYFTADGTYKVYIPAADVQPNQKVSFYRFSGHTGTLEIDDIIVEEGDEDRSVNKKGLIVNGTVTRSPVATGAELVAYSGFSAINYLEQPYNSALDFGTGDFCVMGWVNLASTGYGALVHRSAAKTSTGDAGFCVLYFPTGVGFKIGVQTCATTTYRPMGLTHICAKRDGTVGTLYINGQLVATNSGMTNSATVADATLLVGGYWQTGIPVVASSNDKFSLVRISATSPSVEQIKKIYEDEKVLFQENAAATLYGTSDAVTALAHDEDTGLLHVGTSAGRSVFQGLRRVSNTTTAVGTAISASNGLVVEE